MSEERIALYEAHIKRLVEEQQDLEVVRRRIRWVPLGLLTSPIGFYWSLWIALALAASWLTLWGVTQYLNRVRRWWIVMELDDTRRELARARHALRKRGPASSPA
jgi:hypothetical protein